MDMKIRIILIQGYTGSRARNGRKFMIREMNYADIPACAEILCSVYNNDLWQCRWEHAAALEYLSDIFNMPKFLGYVVVENGEILGGVFAREKVWWNNSEVYIEELFVKPAHQGRGYGTMLMKRVEQYVLENKLAGITLSTNRYAPAADYYRRNGFTDCEHVLFLCREM